MTKHEEHEEMGFGPMGKRQMERAAERQSANAADRRTPRRQREPQDTDRDGVTQIRMVPRRRDGTYAPGPPGDRPLAPPRRISPRRSPKR